ncbi:unnamed protein product [Orchesella dallaii]|uniref:Uncharacterized protein n=1 Tax=Orchesella dallaii TaxID=48710 RepID=A0ABP1QIE7_9HEXA
MGCVFSKSGVSDVVLEELGGGPTIYYETNDDFSQELSILPLIMKKSLLSFPTTLKCRELKTSTKSVVDSLLKDPNEKSELHYFVDQFIAQRSPYFFNNVTQLDNFITHFDKVKRGSEGNLFVNSSFKFWAPDIDFYERTIELLTRFGHLIRDLELNIQFVNPPASLVTRLIRVLHRVPNLERLSVYFRGVPAWINVFDENQLEWYIGRVVQMPKASEFPRLPQLVEMNFAQVDRHLLHRPTHPFSEVTRVVVEAYGRQLSKMKCGNDLFGITMNIPPALFTQNLNNLRELTLCGFERNLYNSMGILNNVQLPKIRRLSLSFLGDVWGNLVGVSIPATFVTLLNNLKESLEELHLWREGLDDQTFEFERQPLDQKGMMILPKLKRLSIEPPDLISNLWIVFETQMKNLESLEFRTRHDTWLAQLPDAFLDVCVRRYFSVFPILNQFLLKHLERNGIKKTLISRDDAQQGKRKVSFEQRLDVRQI